MATAVEGTSSDVLVDAARQTSRGMRAVAAGKAADAATHSDARSFIGIASLLDRLVGELERQHTLAQRRGESLGRIAELRVRDGAQLIERGDWHKIAGELREIAGECLASEPSNGRAIGSNPEGDRRGQDQA